MDRPEKEQLPKTRCEGVQTRTYNPDWDDMSARHVLTDINPPLCARCIEIEPDENVLPKAALYGYRVSPETGHIDQFDELVYCEQHKQIGMLHAETGALNKKELQAHDRIIEQARKDLIRRQGNESRPIDMSWVKREHHLPFTSGEIAEMGAFNFLGRSCGCEESFMILAQQYTVKEAEANYYKRLWEKDQKKRAMQQQEPGESTRRKIKKGGGGGGK